MVRASLGHALHNTVKGVVTGQVNHLIERLLEVIRATSGLLQEGAHFRKDGWIVVVTANHWMPVCSAGAAGIVVD